MRAQKGTAGRESAKRREEGEAVARGRIARKGENATREGRAKRRKSRGSTA
eukprot:SAG11_NODE_38284_length_253_cov_0.642857_1_plen_50_part_10